MLLRLQYQCEFNETNPCFNASANVLYTEQARELAQSGGIDDVALEEMSEAEKQAELAKREAEKASQAFQKWVRISRVLANARPKNLFFLAHFGFLFPTTRAFRFLSHTLKSIRIIISLSEITN